METGEEFLNFHLRVTLPKNLLFIFQHFVGKKCLILVHGEVSIR